MFVWEQKAHKQRPQKSWDKPAKRFVYVFFFCGQKLRVVFTGGSFRFAKGCEFLLVSLGEGFGVGFRWVVGGGLPVEEEGKGEGGGEAVWGPAKELASQCARVCQNYPLANYPLVPPRFLQESGCVLLQET